MLNLSLNVYLITKRDKISFIAFKPNQMKWLPHLIMVYLPNGQIRPHKKMFSFRKPMCKGHCKTC